MSVRTSPPTAIRPASGRSRPATQFRVVVFPHPEGPRSVTNSPCRIVIETSSTARTPPSKSLTSGSITRSPDCSATKPRSQQALPNDDRHEGQDQLRRGQRYHRPRVSLPPELDHRGSDHLGASGDEEQGARVLLQEAHEEQDEGGGERRPKKRDEDRAHRREPRRAGHAAGAVKLARDAQDRRHDRAKTDRQEPDGERDGERDERVADPADPGNEKHRPEEADAHDDPRYRAWVQRDVSEGTSQREVGAIRHEYGERDEERREQPADGRDDQRIPDAVHVGGLLEDLFEVVECEELEWVHERRQERGRRLRGGAGRGERDGRDDVQPQERRDGPAHSAEGHDAAANRLTTNGDVAPLLAGDARLQPHSEGD